MNARTATLVLALALALLGSLAEAASAADSPWIVRAMGIDHNPDLDARATDGDGNRFTFSSNASTGFALDVERRFGDRWSAALGIAFGSADVELRFDEASSGEILNLEDDVSMTPIVAGLHYHLTPEKRADVYLGPVVAYVLYGDFTLAADGANVTLDAEDEFDLGARLGVDVGLGRSAWTFSAALLYLDGGLDLSGPAEVSLDGNTIRVDLGVGLRF